jgi:hypothetical protein
VGFDRRIVAVARRVAILYGLGRYFLCRHCYDLSYQSQRDNAMYRALHKAQAIRERRLRQREHDATFPGEAQGDALEDLRVALVGAPRGRDGAANWYEGVAR